MILTILLLAAALAVTPRFLRWRAGLKKSSELEMARLIRGPVFIRSQFPGDPNPERTAEYLRVLILEAGNTWISPQDVHVRVYHPNMGNGQNLSMPFEVWEQMVDEEKAAIRKKFAIETATVNNEIRDAILGQNGKGN